MEEIIKHINDTNASYRDIKAGDAKNTDLFLDQEHKQFFLGFSTIRVVFHKENLMQAILFISSVLPRKYDRSSEHYKVLFSTDFVYDNILKLEGLFDGKSTFEMNWTIRTGVPKKNGEIDERFYMNGLLYDYTYLNKDGDKSKAKFTIRDYLAGGYSNIHFKKTNEAGVYDVFITNTTEYKSEKDLDVEEIIEKVNNLPLQQIFYGAPGTGKSHKINEQTKGESVIRTTFHPDSDYSTFVGAYKPTTLEVPVTTVIGTKAAHVEGVDGKPMVENKIVYEFVAQAFLQAYILAWKFYSQPTDEGVIKPQYLVIEEINRGNCAQIFGDIFQLLDRDDNGFSKYEITSDADLQKYIAEQNLAVSDVCDSHGKDISDKINSGELLKLPNNLYIRATMNTSDQSLFPIDSAFKRRWDWKYIPIDTNKENWTIKTAKKEYSWSSFLQKINYEIYETTHSEDKMLGFYFSKADDCVISSEKFVGKVLFYVYNDVFKDYGFSREMFKGDDGKIISFHSYYNLDGSIDENKVEKFLDNLEVDGVDDVDSNDAPQESEDVVGDKLTETQQLRKAYWEAFLKFANNSNEEYRKYFNRRRTPSTDKWFNFSIGSKDCHLVVEQTRSRNELATGLYIPKSMALFYKLRENKENIENEIGYPFDWKELPEKKASYIVATINDIDFEANDRESSQFDVIIKRLLRMREVFKKYIDL